jgi:hypothetical protein
MVGPKEDVPFEGRPYCRCRPLGQSEGREGRGCAKDAAEDERRWQGKDGCGSKGKVGEGEGSRNESIPPPASSKPSR